MGEQEELFNEFRHSPAAAVLRDGINEGVLRASIYWPFRYMYINDKRCDGSIECLWEAALGLIYVDGIGKKTQGVLLEYLRENTG